MKVNTELCVDLKTRLRTDACMKPGKDYVGLMRRDVPNDGFGYEHHYTFVEACICPPVKRNPHVYAGRHITVTVRGDGTLRPNLRPARISAGFDVLAYAAQVAAELFTALSILLEERRAHR